MTRKLYLLLAGAVISGALVAACGGGATNSSTSTTGARTTSSSTTTSASTPASTSTSTSTSTSSSSATTTSTSTHAAASTPRSASPPANRALVVAVCKSEIQKLSTAALTSDEKAQLNHLCDVAGSGNAAQLRAAEKQICLTVIKDSAAGLPAVALKAAEQSCGKVGQTPGG
jgi:hypothetical protein